MDPKAPEAMMRPLLTRYPVLAPLAEALALAERLLFERLEPAARSWCAATAAAPPTLNISWANS
jgi:hypothetical protein